MGTRPHAKMGKKLIGNQCQCKLNKTANMFSFKRLFFIIFGFTIFTLFSAVVIYFNGLSNFDSSIGVPTSFEVNNFLRPLRYQNAAKLFLDDDGNSLTTLLNSDKILHRPLSTSTPTSSATPYIVKEEIRKRLDKVNTLCKKYHLGLFTWPNGTNDLSLKDPPTPQYSYMFFNRKHHVAWCPVYKAGSTSFLKNMMLLQGVTEDNLLHPPKQLSVWAREVYPDFEPGTEFDTATKILVVRHPFTRLISAYRDKLSNSSTGLEHGTAHFYNKYGKTIVQKFRKNETIQQLEPTFEEFVKYLIKTDLINYADDHWLPAYYSCTPCRVSYDYIAKVETYMEDQKYIIEQMNLSKIIKPQWQHSSSSNNKSSNSYKEKKEHNIAQYYFSQLTKSQIMALYQKYYLDFHLFGYSYKDYVQYGKKN